MPDRRHQPFLIVLLLFVSFRLLAIFTLRTGGFVADFSDYDFYYAWGQLTAMGYETYETLWTAYPPLFPALMLPIFEASSRIPPWIEPRLFFHLLFGFFLLLFESANLVLIYRLAGKLHESPVDDQALFDPPAMAPALWSAILYALLFVPAYTLLGWFEAMPLFFMLLGLDLLLMKSRWGWPLSAVAAALGFLIKLTPALLVPIAIRWLGAKLSWRAARDEWFNPRSPGNLMRPAIYSALFLGIVVGLGYWLVDGRTALALSSFRIQSIRPPWQSLWALLDGYYGYGLVPLDMRNLVNFQGILWETRLPWTWITLAFMALYLWLYTRRYAWEAARTPIAFGAISVIWLFLYSKGWSPQFLVWILAFVVLLLPTMRGVVLAIVLSLINFVESYLFLIVLPDAGWLMVGTVLFRTLLLLLLTVELLGQIWPQDGQGQFMRRWSSHLTWATMALALVAALVATPRVADAYQDRRWAEEPCQPAIVYLQEQAQWPTDLIVSEEIEIWRDLYPWLKEDYAFQILDTYSPLDEPADAVLARQLDELALQGEFWWVVRTPSVAAERYFDGDAVQLIDSQTLGACTIARVVTADAESEVATIDVAGGPVRLIDMTVGQAQAGRELPLVLYWLVEQPVLESYTVFTQLLDSAGNLIVQQDNLPVGGLAPTDTWTTGQVIRDPYRLELPAQIVPGAYELLVGMYDADGRRTITLPEGTQVDSLSLPIQVAAQ